jgi:hypothetical protein
MNVRPPWHLADRKPLKKFEPMSYPHSCLRASPDLSLPPDISHTFIYGKPCWPFSMDKINGYMQGEPKQDSLI